MALIRYCWTSCVLLLTCILYVWFKFVLTSIWVSSRMSTGRASEKAQESLKSPATLLEHTETLPEPNSSEGWAYSAEGCARIQFSENLLHLFCCMVCCFFKDCSVFLAIMFKYLQKICSKRDILRVNGGWINKTLQSKHCHWSLNTEIFWSHHLIQCTWDNEFYGICNVPSFSWQVENAVFKIYRISDLLVPQEKME